MNKKLEKAFGGYDNGFTLTFENGLVLSTRFGPGNYCENLQSAFAPTRGSTASPLPKGSIGSDTAEVAVWDNAESNTRNWVSEWQGAVFGDMEPADDVRGYVSLADWLQILAWCKEWKR